jgi:pimeloyl-ACP methyl ester carboxylesterase
MKDDKKKDVILFGYSMGGLVVANAMPLLKAASISILGLLVYDTLFYGSFLELVFRTSADVLGLSDVASKALSLAVKVIVSGRPKAALTSVAFTSVVKFALQDKETREKQLKALEDAAKEGFKWTKERAQFSLANLKYREFKSGKYLIPLYVLYRY